VDFGCAKFFIMAERGADFAVQAPMPEADLKATG